MSSTISTGNTSHLALRSRLQDARRLTDELFSLVRPEALYDRPIPERHRLIFYLGHLEAFDWNLLARHTGQLKSFHPEFDQLFAFGIDPVDGGLPSDQPKAWPTEAQVRQYDARVRSALDDIIDATDPTLLHVAIEHRLMHGETLAYLLHQLALQKKAAHREAAEKQAEPLSQKDQRMVPIPAGIATLGQPRDGAFGWDNEFEETTEEVPAFNAGVFPVTNAQFAQFLAAGGYQNPAFWSAEDWQWKESAGLEHPVFWRRDHQTWRLRTMFAEVPLPDSWPVYVSHAEAAAFARWAGKALPTEPQWHRMAYGTKDPSVERKFPWGDSEPAPEHGNFDFSHWDTTPVNAYPQGVSAFGIADLIGNGWEWTSTPFAPLPGFHEFPFYPGYSANFFDGKHFVLKGGSSRTAACMLRRSFRNWFQPHYPYLYAKFRCVES